MHQQAVIEWGVEWEVPRVLAFTPECTLAEVWPEAPSVMKWRVIRTKTAGVRSVGGVSRQLVIPKASFGELEPSSTASRTQTMIAHAFLWSSSYRKAFQVGWRVSECRHHLTLTMAAINVVYCLCFKNFTTRKSRLSQANIAGPGERYCIHGHIYEIHHLRSGH